MASTKTLSLFVSSNRAYWTLFKRNSILFVYGRIQQSQAHKNPEPMLKIWVYDGNIVIHLFLAPREEKEALLIEYKKIKQKKICKSLSVQLKSSNNESCVRRLIPNPILRAKMIICLFLLTLWKLITFFIIKNKLQF